MSSWVRDSPQKLADKNPSDPADFIENSRVDPAVIPVVIPFPSPLKTLIVKSDMKKEENSVVIPFPSPIQKPKKKNKNPIANESLEFFDFGVTTR